MSIPIIELDRDGKVVGTMGDGLFGAAHGLKVDREGNLWVTDRGAHTVLKLSSAGRVLMVMGRKGRAGEGEDEFDGPTDIAFAANGDFYISDGYGNARVAKFRADGSFITAWGKPGKGPGEFNLPHAVAVDVDGKVYVGDRENYRLQIFDANGKFLDQWDHVGSPWGLHITPEQVIYMADGHNNRVLKLNRKGKILGCAGQEGQVAGAVQLRSPLWPLTYLATSMWRKSRTGASRSSGRGSLRLRPYVLYRTLVAIAPRRIALRCTLCPR